MRIQVGGYHDISKIQWAEIDDEDAEVVAELKWAANHTGHTIYAMTRTGGIPQLLHRVVMGLVPGDKEIINHKNGNGLDNRKANLEICDHLYNCQSFRKPNSTNNIGNVTYRPKERGSKKWSAQIQINKKRHEKRFATEAEGRAWISTLVQEHLA